MRTFATIFSLLSAILIPIGLHYFGLVDLTSPTPRVRIPLSVFYADGPCPFTLSAQDKKLVEDALRKHHPIVEGASLFIEPHVTASGGPGLESRPVPAFSLNIALESGDALDVRHRVVRDKSLPHTIADTVQRAIAQYLQMDLAPSPGVRRTITISGPQSRLPARLCRLPA